MNPCFDSRSGESRIASVNGLFYGFSFFAAVSPRFFLCPRPLADRFGGGDSFFMKYVKKFVLFGEMGV